MGRGEMGVIKVLWEGRISVSGEERCESECVRKQMFPHSSGV